MASLQFTASSSPLPSYSHAKLAALGLSIEATSADSVEDVEAADTSGAAVWAGSVSLAEELLARPELVAGTRVLELGCGVGVAGLAAAVVGAASVVLTDGNPSVLALCRRNIEANRGKLGAGTCECVTLEWGEVHAAAALAAAHRPEVVIGADVGYDPSSQDALARTLVALSRRSAQQSSEGAPPPLVVVLAEATRYRDVHGFLRTSLADVGGLSLVAERKLADKVVLLQYESGRAICPRPQ
ncbi:unnamed protein product [Polarella glacialis]|uniref:Calmodulin-lysine N-methyltransferase n=1 Tax=Polarella glacialis TaxID=89957 RepID=A0A813JKZ2_POLGL|nr:unnamed protein product [Polarella glacialis]CAE8684092.1 unnamed protein product [Polarella glacialis]|mmetsp:Transcript_101273/g.182807  ORF Transcript_101273/g.182807 Transcript_101273/m.182807 type:complete len:242 (+) Transcript_101273:187-912(+)